MALQKDDPDDQGSPVSGSILLEVRKLRKVYRVYRSNRDRLLEIFGKRVPSREHAAVDDVSFVLHSGETLGIIGLNGAGKSTLLKMIAGVIEPSEGEILRRGRVTALLELGTGFEPHLSGRENIYLNGELIGMRRDEIAAVEEEIIAFSELAEAIDEPLQTYSSGMIMRLAFSIALFSRPDILIVDEALSVGDAHFSAKCTRALRERKEEAMAILYVSHDLNSLKILCDRLLLLDRGRLIGEGSPDEVVRRYNFLLAGLEGEAAHSQENGSYGTFEARIESVSIRGSQSGASTLSSGEEAAIEIVIDARHEVKAVTVGIMIRDRFGQDIFGTNTLHQGLSFDLAAGTRHLCRFFMPIDLGAGRYTLTVALHKGLSHDEACIHWYDDAAEFEIAGVRGPLFAGLCRLTPAISWQKIEKR